MSKGLNGLCLWCFATIKPDEEKISIKRPNGYRFKVHNRCFEKAADLFIIALDKKAVAFFEARASQWYTKEVKAAVESIGQPENEVSCA